MKETRASDLSVRGMVETLVSDDDVVRGYDAGDGEGDGGAVRAQEDWIVSRLVELFDRMVERAWLP